MKYSNVTWNILGLGVPLIFAVVAIPILLRTIGDEKFGVFMLAWSLVGFATIFDFGIGRATTHELSKRGQGGRQINIETIFFTAERLAYGAGAVGAITILTLVQLGSYRYLTYSPTLEQDIYYSGLILGLTLPLQIVSAMYLGVNEAYGQYRGISIIRIALGITNFMFPAALSFFTTDLTVMVGTLLVSRFAALFAYRNLAIRQIAMNQSTERLRGSYDPQEAKRILGFGLWTTVSSILNPLMTQSDRFLIGAIVSVTAVSAYAVPFEVTTKLLIIPGAITTVMFPFVTSALLKDRGEAMEIFWRWFTGTFFVMLAAVVAFYFLSPKLLEIWLGEELQSDMATVARVIVIGLLPYTAGTMMVSLVHAQRRPDVTAKSHIVQAPLYIALAYWMIDEYGIIGASVAWTVRVTFDALILLGWQICSEKAQKRRPVYE